MKTKYFLLALIVFTGTDAFSQVIKKSPVAKPVIKTTPAVNKMPQPEKKPPPPPTDLQRTVVNIIVGDDGKDGDTKLGIVIKDENKRISGYFGSPSHDMFGNPFIAPASTGEYFTGDNETIPLNLEASVPTGELRQASGGMSLPVLREANLSDFSNGGSVQISIAPNGHDTWKIKSLSVSLFFNNDPGTPHKITWTNITLSQDSRTKDLEFDQNFNAIQ